MFYFMTVSRGGESSLINLLRVGRRRDDSFVRSTVSSVATSPLPPSTLARHQSAAGNRTEGDERETEINSWRVVCLLLDLSSGPQSRSQARSQSRWHLFCWRVTANITVNVYEEIYEERGFLSPKTISWGMWAQFMAASVNTGTVITLHSFDMNDMIMHDSEMFGIFKVVAMPFNQRTYPPRNDMLHCIALCETENC